MIPLHKQPFEVFRMNMIQTILIKYLQPRFCEVNKVNVYDKFYHMPYLDPGKSLPPHFRRPNPGEFCLSNLLAG